MFSGPAFSNTKAGGDADRKVPDSDSSDNEATAERQNWLSEAKVEQEDQDRQNREEGITVEDAFDSGGEEFGSKFDFEEV